MEKKGFLKPDKKPISKARERLSALMVKRISEPGNYHDGGGLYLQVSRTANRTKTWFLRYTIDGKVRDMGLGSVSEWGLADARERAKQVRRTLDDKLDPIEVRKADREAQKAAVVARAKEIASQKTFEECARACHTSLKSSWKNPKHAEQWINKAELQVQKQSFLVQGTVRIAAPPGIASELVVPLARRIRQDYPQIFLQVLSGIELVNLGRGEADLSLRTIRPTDADLVCAHEMSTPMRVYAAPHCAAQHALRPQLHDLPWVGWAAPYQALRVHQELNNRIPGFQPVFTSDDFLVQLAACEAGVGAMVLPQALVNYARLHRQLALQELDIDLGPDAVGALFVVCHKRHLHLPKVQLVIDYLGDTFRALEPAHQERR